MTAFALCTRYGCGYSFFFLVFFLVAFFFVVFFFAAFFFAMLAPPCKMGLMWPPPTNPTCVNFGWSTYWFQ
jgi:hypothetical protein